VNAFPGATAPVPGSPYSYLMGVAGRPGVVPWLPNDEPPDGKSFQVTLHFKYSPQHSKVVGICKTFYSNIKMYVACFLILDLHRT
jgi:hypothetical protein